MKRIFTYQITCDHHDETILTFLSGQRYSHHTIVHLKKTKDGICRNGEWAKVRDRLHTGDLLTITLLETISGAIVPCQLPFPIIYEDEDLVVVNKPAGMPIHPSQGNHDNTLANAATYYYQQKGETFTYRCINRLDRDTTGLLILARHMHSASLLSQMVADRTIKREYLAIVCGKLTAAGTVRAPIGRVEGGVIERQVDYEHGAAACTHYHPIGYKNGYTLVSLRLDTGRTHQIRVHMKHLGHPLPGDFLYHPDYSVINRQALHSHRLTFLHPITGNRLSFTAPLPDDMQFVPPENIL